MSHFTDTTGKQEFFKQKFISRQQLHWDDDQRLADFLRVSPSILSELTDILNYGLKDLKNYDVFVFELCEGNISKESAQGLGGKRLELADSTSICDQLLDGLIQLEKSDKCHNDLKPENILFKIEDDGTFKVKISDFGQSGRTGGTPGCTWPKFLTKREPGKSDTYSIALLLLYTMCDDREVFYRIRSNYVDPNRARQWLDNFRNDPFFKLIIDMMNLKLSPKEAKCRWNQIRSQVQIITKEHLWQAFGIDDSWLRVQDGMDFAQVNFADLSLLDG